MRFSVKRGVVPVVAAAVGVLIAVATVQAFPQRAEAATRNVGPGGYSTIQSAIDASSDGDTVNVSPGTYRERIVITKHITLHGADRSSTIIRNPGGAPEVVFISGVGYSPVAKTVVTGFSIADGNAPDGHGGGMTIVRSDPIISANVFDSNRAASYGGAIASLFGSRPTIVGNIFQRNSAAHGGGAVFAQLGSSPTIANNDFTGNSSSGWATSDNEGGSSGGAIYLENSSGGIVQPTIVGNRITGNTADFAGGGIMLRTGVSATIDGNTIANNRATYGAGIHAETSGASVTVSGNTITGNTSPASAQYGGGFGGAVAVFDRTAATIDHNTISGNRASRGGGAIVVAQNSTGTIDSNVIRSNGIGAAGQRESADGGAIYLAQSTVAVVNNAITDNDANQGGAIGVLDGATANIVNNTIAFNTERYSPGGAVFFVKGAAGGALTNNVLYSNSNYQLHQEANVALVKRNDLIDRGPNGSGAATIGGVVTAATASDLNRVGGTAHAADNFGGDPAFVDSANRDLRIGTSSPAVDKSTTTDAPGYPTRDARNALRAGADDVGAYEALTSPLIVAPVYRFWSDSKKAHFYTISVAERDLVVGSYVPTEWHYEGMAYNAFTTQVAGSVPLYRFYSQQYGGHFYTASREERDLVMSRYPETEWKYEQIAFYVYPLGYTATPTQAVYRFWSPENRHHFYTANDAERDLVRANYRPSTWTYEGANYLVPR